MAEEKYCMNLSLLLLLSLFFETHFYLIIAGRACTRWIVNYCLSCRFVLSIDYYLLVFLKLRSNWVCRLRICLFSSSFFALTQTSCELDKGWAGSDINFLYYFALKPLTNSLTLTLVCVLISSLYGRQRRTRFFFFLFSRLLIFHWKLN